MYGGVVLTCRQIYRAVLLSSMAQRRLDRRRCYLMHESLATKLRVLRAERGLTVRQVAELSGVAKETISQIERGERHPYDRTLAKLAHAYDVPVEELLEEPVAIAERSLAGSPKGEAPETGPASPEASPLLEDPRVQDWLEDQDAALLLMSDQDFVDHVAEVHELEDLETLAGELASEKDRVLTSKRDRKSVV